MATAANQLDLFDGLLDIEEAFYKEGYDLGIADGAEAGYTEGSVFGVEKGFEKFVELGRLYGKALVWAQRSSDNVKPTVTSDAATPVSMTHKKEDIMLDPSICRNMSVATPSSRFLKNLGILLELVDPATLVMKNDEDAVNDTDERLKGAMVKAKLIQRGLGEREDLVNIHPGGRDASTAGDGTGSIEDISSLTIRH